MVGIDPVTEHQREKLKVFQKYCERRNELAEGRITEMWKTFGKGADAVKSGFDAFSAKGVVSAATGGIGEALQGVAKLFGSDDKKDKDEKKEVLPKKSSDRKTAVQIANPNILKSYLKTKTKCENCRLIEETSEYYKYECCGKY